MPPYKVIIPGSPVGGTQPTIGSDTTIIISHADVEPGATLAVDSPAVFICGINSYTYDTVNNPSTGDTWMDKNLGASQSAVSPADWNAYGGLFQWGRHLLDSNGVPDHHEFILWTGGATGVPAYDTTSTTADSDYPGHSFFIVEDVEPFDWRTPQNDNLWQGTAGINNPCPDGFRLPTSTELGNEMVSWGGQQNINGAYNSPLKLTAAGRRDVLTGQLVSTGNTGFYWSSTVTGFNNSAHNLYFGPTSASIQFRSRGDGLSIRCIKDNTGGGQGQKVDGHHE
jgi:uncharacterized protein (TIGR02145 family)